MSRRPKGTERLFERQDIYDIRRFWDEKFELGWSFARIADALLEKYYPASAQTLIRIGKRETWRELGVGSAERPIISNRLLGENRSAGDYARPFHRRSAVEELSDEEIARRSIGVVVPEPEITPDGRVKTKTPGQEGLAMLLDRAGVVMENINPPKKPPPDLLDGGEAPDEVGESVESILARKAEEGKK